MTGDSRQPHSPQLLLEMSSRRLGGALAQLQPFATTKTFDRDEEICRQAGPADYWYSILAGAARMYVVRSSGQRRIVDLLLPGDCFGLTMQSRHQFAVQAVSRNTVVACFPRCRIETLATTEPQIARVVREWAFDTIARLQSHLLVLGHTTATEKVSGFLLELVKRLSDRRSGLTIPVSRYDIADHLGVSAETVSRSITELKDRGLITLAGPRRLSILDCATLEERTNND